MGHRTIFVAQIVEILGDSIMGRKKKVVNNSGYPDWVIERVARCLYDDIVADFAKPEVLRDFEAWQLERQLKADLERNERSRYNGKIDSF